jgi:hypothetical protein
VETNFNAFIFKACEEFIDAVDASVGCLSVKEAGLYEALGDSFLSIDGLHAIESPNVGKSRLDDLRDSLCVGTATSCTSQACTLSVAVAVVK